MLVTHTRTLLTAIFVAQDEISNDPNTHGSVFCPVILGSDKDTVSVATGQNEYYPLYMSHGLVHNTTRRAQLPWLPFSPFLKVRSTSLLEIHIGSIPFSRPEVCE